jgi:predicted TPR repeat methyltransferase
MEADTKADADALARAESLAEGEFTIAEIIQLAVAYLQGQHWDKAGGICEAVLSEQPDHPDATHYLGVAKFNEGEVDEAFRLIRRSIKLVPKSSGYHNNLGNMLAKERRHTEAIEVFTTAARLSPRDPDICNNLGISHRWLGHNAAAEKSFRRALALQPNHAGAQYNLAKMLFAQKNNEQAIALLRKALANGVPRAGVYRSLLASIYVRIDDDDSLKALLAEWQSAEKDNPTAKHMLAATGNAPMPERASDAYVVAEFDEFAKTFDLNLRSLLYKAPQLVNDALLAAIGPPAGKLDILDAGCGTGLCAPFLRPHAKNLIGVDLSTGMLAKAKERGGFDELVAAELTAYLDSHPAAFDVIVSADVLMYFGNIEPVMTAAARALKPGGTLVFTTEHWKDGAVDDTYGIQKHGRYRHTEPYARAALEAAGLAVTALGYDVLRVEYGEPVNGIIVTARKASLN